ncbi:hypothetical protein [Oryzibacter oryziterrae]|uniref:hypothetical protein n=1 Tax=Oryzibacter oryziterrae TaxID=2766474 RepID=UPI001F427EEB|nr:hypothetical protein [Oryzibacter oryziterrae]
MPETGHTPVVARQRDRDDLEFARTHGLIGSGKDARFSARVSSRLLEAARARTGVQSSSDLLEVALARLAAEDDFMERMRALKGSIPTDVDLEF